MFSSVFLKTYLSPPLTLLKLFLTPAKSATTGGFWAPSSDAALASENDSGGSNSRRGVIFEVCKIKCMFNDLLVKLHK